MFDIPEEDNHQDYYDLFERTPHGWLCYNGHDEWGKLSDRRFAKDVRDGIRQSPERIDKDTALEMIRLADQED